MPRRQFRADLSELQTDSGHESIQHVRPCGDDNEFSFTLRPSKTDDECIVTCLVLPDVAEYPFSHEYQIFASDNAAPAVASTLVGIQTGKGLTVAEMLLRIAQAFDEDDEFDGCGESDDDDTLSTSRVHQHEPLMEGVYCDDDFGFDDNVGHAAFVTRESNEDKVDTDRARMRDDLLAAKDAGFKIGIDHRMTSNDKCCVSLAIRVSKLGLSEEAMQAWHIRSHEYLILVMWFTGRYRSLESLLNDPRASRSTVSFRVGVSTTYKPSHQEILVMSQLTPVDNRRSDEIPELTMNDTCGWRDAFISRSLNDLLNQKWLPILQARSMDLDWTAAEAVVHELHHEQKVIEDDRIQHLRGLKSQDTSQYPAVVNADHFGDWRTSKVSQPSGPLVAIQYLLRRFVRCTEFCLVCHLALDDGLQAIKPYVCDNPLCLYQYMTLGFGTSIEHEILTQPSTVDLLISFCWKAAEAGNLDKFPIGMTLMTPDPVIWQSQAGSNRTSEVEAVESQLGVLRAKLDYATHKFTLEKGDHKIRVGDWIMSRILAHGKDTVDLPWRHHRVVRVYGPDLFAQKDTIHHCRETLVKKSDAIPESSANQYIEQVEVARWDCNFDDLSSVQKCATIINLIGLLPSVAEMKGYLKGMRHPNLSEWTDRLPDAVHAVLRWIIASNRACIMQTMPEEMVPGFKDGWMQFRFAMGAPDKEARFVKHVIETKDRLRLPFPTLFAWHGSPVRNWHSIIREGLHFEKTANGRAYGHGIYLSPCFDTSFGYSQDYSRGMDQTMTAGQVGWPRSTMGIACALSLNEVVNARAEFVHSDPHYVVNKVDWVQTRYLFIKCVVPQQASSVGPLSNTIPQDPAVTPTGESRHPIQLPCSATPRALRALPTSERSLKVKVASMFVNAGLKKRKIREEVLDADSDAASIATLAEDANFLHSEENEAVASLQKVKLTSSKQGRITCNKLSSGFMPGTLDYALLPRLPPPPDATPNASKQLLHRFKALKKVQDESSPGSLGWYVDPRQFDDYPNIFQWILEFHSFGADTLLAIDMKSQGVTSIVLEFRFPPEFPFAPPFARIIRPRLLPFSLGGGGHVTLGGSLCMQLLTNDGWLPTMDMESVLTSIRLEITDPDPRPARLDMSNRSDYSIGEAIDGYMRACNAHGWRVPADFRHSMAQMDQASSS